MVMVCNSSKIFAPQAFLLNSYLRLLFSRSICVMMVISFCLFGLLLPYPHRIYCITDIDPDHRKLSQLEAVIRFLTGEEPDLECKFSPSQRPCWVLLYLPQGNENCEADWCQTEFPRHLFMQAGLNLSLA